jgi:hypothetical protein
VQTSSVAKCHVRMQISGGGSARTFRKRGPTRIWSSKTGVAVAREQGGAKQLQTRRVVDRRHQLLNYGRPATKDKPAMDAAPWLRRRWTTNF